MHHVVNKTRHGFLWPWAGIATLCLLADCRCAPEGAPPLGPPPAAPRVIGRSVQQADGVHFAWGATAIETRFTGTGVSLKLADTAPGPKGNIYNVLVDDHPPLVLAMQPNITVYSVAHDLSPGEHSLSVIKRTEAFVGEARFAGLVLDGNGTVLPPPPAKARRLEFIGDSITAGYGNEGANEKCGFSPDDENGDLAFGPMSARALDAEAAVIAWAGKGMLRNRDGSTTDTIPQLYNRILPEKAQPVWDFKQWVPDAVVINLGTNDFGPGVPDAQAFGRAYDGFLATVRKNYPHATILCALGPMLSDDFPAGQNQLSHARTYIQDAVERRKKNGDARIGFLEFPVQTGHRGYGCQWHPSLATHAAMAAQLTAALKSALAW